MHCVELSCWTGQKSLCTSPREICSKYWFLQKNAGKIFENQNRNWDGTAAVIAWFSIPASLFFDLIFRKVSAMRMNPYWSLKEWDRMQFFLF